MSTIAHCSIPSDDPQRAAQVLAEILLGEAIRFPPGGPHAWMAWSGDGEIELEIVPRGATLHVDADQGNRREDWPRARLNEVHLAICVSRPEAEILAIAKRAGWPARHCDRGGGYFSLAEVWVDGAFMIEFLDPAQTAVYRERVTPKKWKAFLAETRAA
jgi:hypothetical protein